MSQITDLLKELEQRPKCYDWAAKVLFVSRHLWAAMSDPTQFDQAAGPNDLANFASLLEDRTCFKLASSVIPDLCPGAKEPSSSHHRLVLHHLRPLIQEQRDAAAMSNFSYYDTPASHQEKEKFLEVEMHRTKLYLRHSGIFTAKEEEAVEKWLADCPAPMLSAWKRMQQQQAKKMENMRTEGAVVKENAQASGNG